MPSFVLPVRVYYEDTDAGGVVYYANYLRFMERARTEWLRSLGYEQDALIRERGVIFAVRSVQVEYLRPARFNDLLQVSVAVRSLKRASITFEQTLVRAGDGTPLATGLVRVASLDAAAFSPVPIPTDMRKDLERAG